MEHAGVEPGIITWNEVLAACVYPNKYDTSSQTWAFEITNQVFLYQQTIIAIIFALFQAVDGLNQNESVEEAYRKYWDLGFAKDEFVVCNISHAAPHLIKSNQMK